MTKKNLVRGKTILNLFKVSNLKQTLILITFQKNQIILKLRTGQHSQATMDIKIYHLTIRRHQMIKRSMFFLFIQQDILKSNGMHPLIRLQQLMRGRVAIQQVKHLPFRQPVMSMHHIIVRQPTFLFLMLKLIMDARHQIWLTQIYQMPLRYLCKSITMVSHFLQRGIAKEHCMGKDL